MRKKRALLILPGFAALVLAEACARQDAEPTVTADPASDAAEVAVVEQPSAPPPRTVSPAGAAVFFITPADGDTVRNPVRVEFGIDGMSVAPAGVNQPHSGHHHLLVDTDPPDMGLPVPADSNHIHFGDGSTFTELTLAPGEHTLRLLLADYAHIPHNPPVMSEPITITVE